MPRRLLITTVFISIRSPSTKKFIMSSTTDQPTSRRYQIRLEYAKPGTQPPVYVAGSFSTPAWQPDEMSVTELHSEDANVAKEYAFHKEVMVSEGSWQYKFRLGHGDWWVLDDGAKTGTRNVSPG